MLKTLTAIILAVVLATPAVAASSKLGEDGLHREDWFITSLLELRDDAEEAAKAGKHFAIVWEQKGCIYCEQMHDIHLNDARIVDFIKANFHVLQLNYRGDRTVVDFDGTEMSEKELARRNGVGTTPTIHFLPLDLTATAGKMLRDAEAARMPGLLKPDQFLAMFEYVAGKHYQSGQSFQKWLAAKRGS